MDYYKYIHSIEWKIKKQHFLNSNLKYAKKCYVCGAERTPEFHVHHRTYKRLGKENIAVDLVSVCNDCHNKIHSIQTSHNMDLWSATRKARRLHNI